MKILIVANYAKEHINKFHTTTIKAFREQGWQVDVACKADEDVPYANTVYDLPIERNPFRIQSIKAILKLRSIIEKESYDVVHVHTFSGKTVGILAAKKFRKKGLKILYSAHGFQYYKGAAPIEWMLMPFDKWLIRNVDVLITANSEDYETAIKHHFKAKHILQCCGVGVKLEKFKVVGKQRSEVRKELEIPQNAPVLIYVAELNHNKNQEMLLRMFENVVKTCPDLHMLLVGPDHYNGKIQKRIAELKLQTKVHCLGWRSDIPELIKASDIAVASSYREGFGLNIVEYMACNIPVIATNNRGHRETIQDGITGYLVPPDDDELMAKRVIELLRNPEKKKTIIKNASENIYNFEDETIVSRLVDIYKKYLVKE